MHNFSKNVPGTDRNETNTEIGTRLKQLTTYRKTLLAPTEIENDIFGRNLDLFIKRRWHRQKRNLESNRDTFEATLSI